MGSLLDEWKGGIWGGLRRAARSMLQINLMLQDSCNSWTLSQWNDDIVWVSNAVVLNLMESVVKASGATRNSFWLQRLPACIFSIRLRARVKMQFWLCPDSSHDHICLFFFAEVAHKFKGTEIFRQTLAFPALSVTGLWYGTHLSSLSFCHLLALQLWKSYLDTLCYFYYIHEVRIMIPMYQAYCGH